jgi:LDH2 family malate/lactate/ureidoglycolate dehydrogenase
MVVAGRTVRVSADEARSLIERVLLGVDATPEEACTVANVLVEADLRGQSSHGILRLPTIVERVNAGLIRPRATPRLVWTSTALGHMDAAEGFGHVMALFAMRQALQRASDTGIAAIGVRNNNHIGMLAYYAEYAARLGSVAFVLTTSEALVTPFGGAEALIGTNPIAIGFPARPEPFVLDMATSATAMGKVIDRQHRGEPLPGGWAVAADGRPTTDASTALLGALLPFGGAKGYGLGLAVELLAGALVGAALGQDVHGTLDADHPTSKGDLFMAISPRSLPDSSSLPARSSSYLDRIRSSRPAPGTDAVSIPGDHARQRRLTSLHDGITLSHTAWQAALELAP